MMIAVTVSAFAGGVRIVGTVFVIMGASAFITNGCPVAEVLSVIKLEAFEALGRTSRTSRCFEFYLEESYRCNGKKFVERSIGSYLEEGEWLI